MGREKGVSDLKQAIAKLYTDSHTPWPEVRAIDWPDVFADKVLALVSEANTPTPTQQPSEHKVTVQEGKWRGWQPQRQSEPVLLIDTEKVGTAETAVRGLQVPQPTTSKEKGWEVAQQESSSRFAYKVIAWVDVNQQQADAIQDSIEALLEYLFTGSDTDAYIRWHQFHLEQKQARNLMKGE